MAPAKAADEDEVVAEYDVFLTPPIAEEVYLLQYPSRPRNRPYSSKYGASPHAMRIKHHAGFLEVDVQLNTEHNFNKYMGLKWGDASRISKEVHNPTGTYGPAAGLTFAQQPRSSRARENRSGADRELDLDNDLRDFKSAVRDDKVFAKQTLGGQITKHGNVQDDDKPHYFVGAFKDNQLTLTKITGTCQMRPHFHHLDAQEELTRLSVSRAQAEVAGPQPAPRAQTLQQKEIDEAERQTQEFKLRRKLLAAAQERWLDMDYIDEEDMTAYDEFEKTFKIQDTTRLPILKSTMDDWAFLEAMSAPRGNESPTRRRKRASRKKELAEVDGHEADMEVEVEGEKNDGPAG